jgi:hypothetical protein
MRTPTPHTHPTYRPAAAVLAVVLVAAGMLRAPGTQARPHVALRTAASVQLTAHDGKFWAGAGEVVLRGFNVNPGILDSDLAQMQAWGFNFIRLRMVWASLEPTAPVKNPDGTWKEVYDTGYLQNVKDAIRLAKNHGLYVLVSNKGCTAGTDAGCPYFAWPGWQYQAAYNSHAKTYPETTPGALDAQTDFWTDDLRRKWETDMWSWLADQLKGTPGIAGYEVHNEPQMGSMPSSMATTQTAVDYQLAVAQAIRAADPARIVFFTTHEGYGPGVTLANLSGFQTLGNVAFDMHDYFGARWGDGLMENAKSSKYQQAYQDLFNHRLNDTAPTYIGTTLNQKRFVSLESTSLAAKGIPLLVGEIGDDGSFDPGVYAYFGTTVAALNDLGVSWTAFYGSNIGIVNPDDTLRPWASVVIDGATG